MSSVTPSDGDKTLPADKKNATSKPANWFAPPLRIYRFLSLESVSRQPIFDPSLQEAYLASSTSRGEAFQALQRSLSQAGADEPEHSTAKSFVTYLRGKEKVWSEVLSSRRKRRAVLRKEIKTCDDIIDTTGSQSLVSWLRSLAPSSRISHKASADAKSRLSYLKAVSSYRNTLKHTKDSRGPKMDENRSILRQASKEKDITAIQSKYLKDIRELIKGKRKAFGTGEPMSEQYGVDSHHTNRAD